MVTLINLLIPRRHRWLLNWSFVAILAAIIPAAILVHNVSRVGGWMVGLVVMALVLREGVHRHR